VITLFIHHGSCIALVNLFSKKHKWQISEMQPVVFKMHLSMAWKVLFMADWHSACGDAWFHADGP